MTDARRFDFEDPVTAGEAWDFKFSVRARQEDGSYANLQTFTGYDDWAFYVLPSLAVAGGTAEELEAKAYFYLEEGDGITVGTPPDIVLEASDEQTRYVQPGNRAYELWGTVNTKPKRLAYGTIPVVH